MLGRRHRCQNCTASTAFHARAVSGPRRPWCRRQTGGILVTAQPYSHTLTHPHTPSHTLTHKQIHSHTASHTHTFTHTYTYTRGWCTNTQSARRTLRTARTAGLVHTALAVNARADGVRARVIVNILIGAVVCHDRDVRVRAPRRATVVKRVEEDSDATPRRGMAKHCTRSNPQQPVQERRKST